jgi:hypothetical protein
MCHIRFFEKIFTYQQRLPPHLCGQAAEGRSHPRRLQHPAPDHCAHGVGVLVSSSDIGQLPKGIILPAVYAPGAKCLVQASFPALPPPDAVAALVRPLPLHPLAAGAARPSLSLSQPAFFCISDVACAALRTCVDRAHSRASIRCRGRDPGWGDQLLIQRLIFRGVVNILTSFLYPPRVTCALLPVRYGLYALCGRSSDSLMCLPTS